MDTRRYGEISVLHIEPETYTRLLHLAETDPGRPGGIGYNPEDPWHGLIVEPHSYGCWVHTGVAEDGDTDDLPNPLMAVLRDGRASDADWVLFDADLEPMLDLAVFGHRDGPSRPGRKGAPPSTTRLWAGRTPRAPRPAPEVGSWRMLLKNSALQQRLGLRPG